MGEKLNGKEFVEKSGAYLPPGDRVTTFCDTRVQIIFLVKVLR